MNLLMLALLVAGAFWEDKAPAQWTDVEIANFLSDSPWAQIVGSPAKGMPAPPVQVYLDTPTAVAAEKEKARRAKARLKTEPEEDPLAEEFQVWMEDNAKSNIVLVVKIGQNQGFQNGGEVRKMENDSYMQVGKTKYKMTGHFPPSKSDPYLRLAFPRQEMGEEKLLTFSIYVPGLTIPFREVTFRLKDMVRGGKLEL